MSQRVVGFVIDSLLDDEGFRIRFIAEPVETLTDLYARGFALTPDEIDLFMQTNSETWVWTSDQVGDPVH
jgi:hypothetical protein